MNCQIRFNRLQFAGLIAMRLCLVVSLWQAPIPWLHRHGTTENEKLGSSLNCSLDEHLAVFHPLANIKVDFDFGWHLHWVMPYWSHAADDSPDDQPPSQETVVFDQATLSSPNAASHCSDVAVMQIIETLQFVSANLYCRDGIARGWTDRILTQPSRTVLRC